MSIEVRPSLDALQALDWGRGDGLLPAVVQDADTLQVLMLGYVSAESLAATLAIGHMTFFSRSKQRLWTRASSPATSWRCNRSVSTAMPTRCW